MKISFVIGSLNYSGAEKVFSALIEEFKKKNIEISILLLDEEKEYENLNNIHLYGAKSSGGKISRILSRRKKINDNLRKINPDIIVSFGHICNINTLFSVFGTKKAPVIVCERNDPSFDPKSFFQRIIRNILYNFSDGYVFQTPEIKSYFTSKIQKKSKVIKNPICDEVVLNKKYNAFNNKITTVGRLDKYQKNQMLLIKAIEILLIDYPKLILNIYGDGPDKAEYENYVQKKELSANIIFNGKVSNVNEEIIKNDIFVLCSRFEGMPNALIEAMSIGMPCISTDCGGGGAKSIINNNINGLIVPNFNENELALGLKKLIDNSDLRKKYGSEAKKINDDLNIQKVSEEWIDYFTLISKKGI